jgi:hypothetical protein
MAVTSAAMAIRERSSALSGAAIQTSCMQHRSCYPKRIFLCIGTRTYVCRHTSFVHAFWHDASAAAAMGLLHNCTTEPPLAQPRQRRTDMKVCRGTRGAAGSLVTKPSSCMPLAGLKASSRSRSSVIGSVCEPYCAATTSHLVCPTTMCTYGMRCV